MPGMEVRPVGASTAVRRTCLSCTAHKKKCGKQKPTCDRCERLLLKCIYEEDHSQRRADTLQPSVVYPTPPRSILEANLEGSPEGIKTSALESIFAELRSFSEDIQQIATTFFATANTWAFIVYEPSFTARIASFGDHPDPESGLLVLCMRLLTRAPGHSHSDMFGPSYWKLKHLCSLLQTTCADSIELLLSGILLAYYEYGHGACERSYLTASSCVAVIRIQHISDQLDACYLSNPEHSNQVAQRSWAWWSLYVLDRMLQSHSDIRQSLPFLMTHHRDADIHLPYDTKLFAHEGHKWGYTSAPYTSGSPLSVPLGPPRRAAQAAVMLGRAIGLENERRRLGTTAGERLIMDIAAFDKEVMMLIEATFAQAETWCAYCSTFAMCLSALFVVHAPYVNVYIDFITASAGLHVPVLRTAINMILDICRVFNASSAEQIRARLTLLSCSAPQACYLASQALEQIRGRDQGYGCKTQAESDSELREIRASLEVFCQRWSMAARSTAAATASDVPILA